jgi:hypothetical protein
MDGTLSIVSLISGLVALLAIPLAWIWKLSKWDEAIKSLPEMVKNQAKFERRLDEAERKIERITLITEPLWESICANLPGILKMHNSPDPLAHALNGESTEEELVALIARLKGEIEEAKDSNPTRAMLLILALSAVSTKLKLRRAT